MGFTKDLTLDSGVKVSSAYFRIGSLNGDSKNMQFILVAYLNRESFFEGKSFIHTEDFSFKPDLSDNATNFYRQGYAYIKTIDVYKDANDVLEEGQNPIDV